MCITYNALNYDTDPLGLQYSNISFRFVLFEDFVMSITSLSAAKSYWTVRLSSNCSGHSKYLYWFDLVWVIVTIAVQIFDPCWVTLVQLYLYWLFTTNNIQVLKRILRNIKTLRNVHRWIEIIYAFNLITTWSLFYFTDIFWKILNYYNVQQ